MDSLASIKSSMDKLKEVFDVDLGEMRRRLDYVEGLKGGGGSNDELKRLARRLDELEASSKRLPHDYSRAGGGDSGDRGGFNTFADFIQHACFAKSDHRIEGLEAKAATALMSSASAGGILVPEAWQFQLTQYMEQVSIVRGRARSFQSDPQHPEQTLILPLLDYSGGRRAGVEMTWYEEGGTIAASEPAAWDSLDLTAHECGGIVTLSDKLLRNATALEQVLVQILGDALAAAQEYAFWSGNGITQPDGIFEHACVLTVNRENSAEVSFADLVDMLALALPARRYTWVISQTVLPELLKMQFNNSSIAPIWIPSAQEGVPSRLFGYPLMIREDAPILGSYGDVSLCCFDFYGLRDGLGIRVDASQHTGDNFTKGLTSIRIRASVDGKPLLSQPWTLADETTQVSPFVILDTPEGGSGS